MGAEGFWGRNHSVTPAVACTGLKFDSWIKGAFKRLSQEPFQLAFGRVALFLLCSGFHSSHRFAFLPAINMRGKTIPT